MTEHRHHADPPLLAVAVPPIEPHDQIAPLNPSRPPYPSRTLRRRASAVRRYSPSWAGRLLVLGLEGDEPHDVALVVIGGRLLRRVDRWANVGNGLSGDAINDITQAVTERAGHAVDEIGRTVTAQSWRTFGNTAAKRAGASLDARRRSNCRRCQTCSRYGCGLL